MNSKRLISLVSALVMCIGMLTGIVLPASAANPVYIIDPAGTDGAAGTLNGVSGTVYTTYAAFESAFTAGGTADVYFAAGEFGDITVTKSVNLYGPKKGIDPNVKGSDILQPWTLNPNRGSGETVITGKVEIKTTGKGNDVLLDGFTIDKAGQIWANCSAQDHDVTIQNIVVGKNSTVTDYCFWGSPALNSSNIPSLGNYYMTFHLKNVYADGYKGTGRFIRFLATKSAELDNIYFANSNTTFLETSAASTVEDNYVMKNSFLYNNLPVSDLTIFHRYPSVKAQSVTYIDNVFMNAHGTTNNRGNSHTIYCQELKSKTDYRTFIGNTFVSEYGPKAAVRIVASSTSQADGYDVSNMTFTGNRVVGFAHDVNNYDGNWNKSGGVTNYNGTLDLSDNFSFLASAINQTANKIGDFSTVAKCQALTGTAPKGINRGMIAKVDGNYYKDFDMTVGSQRTNVIIDPQGKNGTNGTVNGINGVVYTTYDQFEANYKGTAVADVYFAPGEHAGFTVTKKVNLYGAKKGIDPNVKGSDILQPWTLNANRGSGESIITGKVEIKTTGKGNDVLLDGFTIDKAGQIWANCSAQDHDVTLQNIVVGKNSTVTDYCFWGSPALNSSGIPACGKQYMTFNLRNVYADGYKGTGRFVRFIAAKKAVLDNIYYANSNTTFLETSAASYINDEFVMQNSFLYNNIPTSGDYTILHRFPSVNKTESVTYTDNVFYNAHRSTNGQANSHTIQCNEIKNLTQYYTFTGNTFVSEYGAKAPVRIVVSSQADGDGYDCANMVVKGNRIVGYAYTTNNYDGKFGNGVKKYNGVLDLSDNFNYLVTHNQTANKIGDFSTVAKCQALAGVAPNGINRGIIAEVDGPYYKNFDMTISTDMLRVTGVDLSDASIDGTTIRGISMGDYVPELTYTCGNDIARTMTLKKGSETVSAITESGTYTMTLGYESQSREYTLIVEKAQPYTGEGYMFAPDESGTQVMKYWDDTAYAFTMGTNIFNKLSDLFAKAKADGVAVPKILLPAGEIEGNYTLEQSCEVLGYKHGVNPVVRNPKPTEPDTLSSGRGKSETILKGLWTAKYTADNMTFIFDGIALGGDGRFADSTNERVGETITYKNIYCMPGAMSAAVGQNVRFANSAYSEKTLTYQNLYIDGVKKGPADVPQLFYFNGTDTVVDNAYIANSDLAICSNVFFQSGTDFTKDLSFTMTNSKFFKVVGGAFLITYYGNETSGYNRYAGRKSVKTSFTNNLVYNCSASSESNPYSNALINMRYPFTSFKYEITGNAFVEDREVYHFLTDDKKLGTDVFSQWFHFYPMNNYGKSGSIYKSDVSENVVIEDNRFIGRNTVINYEDDAFTGYIELEDNFFLSYDTVQAMNALDDIYTLTGENPNVAINVRNTEKGVQNYYLDYDMSVSTKDTTALLGTVDKVNHVIELTQKEGKLTAVDFATDKATAAIFADAACTEQVTSIDCAALTDGSHIYYVKYTAADKSDVYALVLNTETTERTYLGATMYDPLAADLPAGLMWYRMMNGTLYSFETGKTVWGDMDQIVIHTQMTAPNVLLPAGEYTAEELSTVESVQYICDENADYPDTVPVKKDKIKVLCVGDSVTLGTGAGNRTLNAYPAQLQNLLGDDYLVLNYGRGGALGTNVAGYGYESLWNYSLALKENPDIVILAFGANDAQNGYNHIPLEYFKEETMDMIAEFQALPSHPIVYMTTTTHIISGWNEEWVNELRATQRATAEAAGITLIDAHSMSLAWGDPASYYNDNCHPNAAGYVKLANDFKTAIDWSAQGAHQPAADEVKISFAAFECEHEAGELIVDTPATCKEAGVGHKNCTVCGEIAEDNIAIEIDPTAHNWEEEYTEDVPATCYTEGSESIHCSLCDATKDSKAIPATGAHVAANEWTQGEDKHYHACTTEGCTAKLDEAEHIESEVIEVIAPQAGVAGVGKIECTECGKVLEDNVVIPALAGGANIGDKNYESLEAALADAKAGDVITMNEDAELACLVLDPEVTLDLNGKALTADYVIGFKGSAVIDGSEEGIGQLKVAKDKVALDQNNGGYLPVYDAAKGSYRLVTVASVKEAKADDAEKGTYYYFSPDLSEMHDELYAGAEACGVKVVVRLSWTKEGNYAAEQSFVYADKFVRDVIDSYGAEVQYPDYYTKMFEAIFVGSEADTADDLTISAVIVSDAGVEIASAGISFAK